MTLNGAVPGTDDLLAMVGSSLDLIGAPFTLPRSRILVLAVAGGDSGPVTELRVSRAEYERPIDECTVFRTLSVTSADGSVLPVTGVLPHVIEFGDGVVTLTFAGPHALSIGADGSAAELRLESPDGEVRLVPLGADSESVQIHVDDSRLPELRRSGDHWEHVAETLGVWAAWMDRCPRVRPDLQQMTAFCWWVLGANIVELPGQGKARAVVPSKIGYVGLWQWDAYFIAVGLRHGDPDLALEQLDLAFRFPTADGQLPDVVHDEGVLASSDDLPPQDRETLRRHGSSIADPARPVPLTKPPLAAWALRKVLDAAAPADAGSAEERWTEAAWDTIARSQDWWFTHSDSDGDGMPEYGHPYSSGLDDSPIFDGDLPLASPDLGAYLVLQDRELAREFAARGDRHKAQRFNDRADATLAGLLGMWDQPTGRFRARAAGHSLASYSAVSLLPLLTGELPSEISATLLRALADPEQFGTPWTVPTVAVCDPDFSPERMWRGPVWININALLVEGLKRSGFDDNASQLAEDTVRLVKHGGGPHEYFNPESGRRAETATTSFGWSAALFVDLAVSLST
ncbi:amylo-alpha-1,6-glucosidase [Mycetocola sp.]|uniref:amylo-alpha-1,6-glucosidase n=1 Tax=Mycetocola sp. TaxID=1871042 RepID=UPI0039898826